MVANGRVRQPSQNRRQRQDEEVVIVRHVAGERDTRIVEDGKLDTKITNEETSRKAAIGTRTPKDGVYGEIEEVQNLVGKNVNSGLRNTVASHTNLIGTVEPVSGLRGETTQLWNILGRDTDNGLREDVKILKQQMNNLLGEKGTLADMRGATQDASQKAGAAQADANAAKNGVDEINNVFRGRSRGFAGSVDLTGAGIAHRHD